VTEQPGAGSDYGKLRRVITVVITYFDLTEDPDDYHHRYFLYDKKHDKIFTSSVEIDIVEVKKLPEREDGTPLWNWGRFFEASTEEEFEMLAEKDAEIGKAVTIIKKLSGSERERRLAEMAEMARMDETVNRRAAFNEGVEQTARTALAKGFSVSDVVDITGLDEDAVKKLQADIIM
jgi:predicted transposase/invertase (TIGR01784 family)